MATFYLVVEEGYDYNDEYYHASEGGDYTINSKLLRNKEAAQKIADAKNEIAEDQDWFRDDENNPIRPFKVIEIEEEEA